MHKGVRSNKLRPYAFNTCIQGIPLNEYPIALRRLRTPRIKLYDKKRGGGESVVNGGANQHLFVTCDTVTEVQDENTSLSGEWVSCQEFAELPSILDAMNGLGE